MNTPIPSKAAKVLKNLQEFLNSMAQKNNPEAVKLTMRALIEKLIPNVSLNDGGVSRGRMVGVLKQLREDLSETLIRGKTNVVDRTLKENNKDLMKGIQEGLSIRNNQSKFEIPAKLNPKDFAKMRQSLGVSVAKSVGPKFSELIRKKLRK